MIVELVEYSEDVYTIKMDNGTNLFITKPNDRELVPYAETLVDTVCQVVEAPKCAMPKSLSVEEIIALKKSGIHPDDVARLREKGLI